MPIGPDDCGLRFLVCTTAKICPSRCDSVIGRRPWQAELRMAASTMVHGRTIGFARSGVWLGQVAHGMAQPYLMLLRVVRV